MIKIYIYHNSFSDYYNQNIIVFFKMNEENKIDSHHIDEDFTNKLLGYFDKININLSEVNKLNTEKIIQACENAGVLSLNSLIGDDSYRVVNRIRDDKAISEIRLKVPELNKLEVFF